MLFNSMDFLIFFPIVVLVYLIIPKRLRYIWLLIISYYFYMCWNVKYSLLLFLSTFITYLSGLLMDRFQDNKNIKKVIVAFSLICNLGILCIFKYSDFFITNLNRVLNLLNINFHVKGFDLLLPVGISFYTFQALSYTIDVYKKNIKTEKNFFRYALFVSFFPQLVAGPIERSKNLLTQIQNVSKIHLWDFERIRDGLILMMWGFFQKLVIADRAALYVNQVINNYTNYGFIEIFLAIILFAFQIYCDFGGYTNIARGCSRIMGFELTKNFKQPYLAVNIKDFWRRWHISLTQWFTDYLYIPLGGNRKGTIRKYINILIVFGVSGLWHGASWNFIVWGLIHACFQIISDIKRKHFKTNNHLFITKLLQIITTFLIVDFAWIFFVAKSLKHALNIIKQMSTCFYASGILNQGGGLNLINFIILGIAIVVLLIVDILHENNQSIIKIIQRQNVLIRWSIYIGMFVIIVMFGIYGKSYDASEFIYFQF